MKIYLVRWPDLRASLVAAKDEEGLVAVLGEGEDSRRATWSVYDGPLSVELRLPAVFHVREREAGAPAGDDEIVVDDVSRVEDGLILDPAGGATHGAMTEQVMRTAFPHLHEVLSGGNDELTEDGLRAAVSEELQVLVKAEWRDAALARGMDGLAAAAHGVPAPKGKHVARPAGPRSPAPSKVRGAVKPLRKPSAKKPRREPEPKAKARGRRSGGASK